jgi:hypothetical protein
MSSRQDRDKIVARALRAYAEKIMDSADQVSDEEGQILDRALRSCSAISDIDTVWVRWSYLIFKGHKWDTSSEIKYSSKTRTYEYDKSAVEDCDNFYFKGR